MRKDLADGGAVQRLGLEHARDDVLHLERETGGITELVVVGPEVLGVSELDRVVQSVLLRVGLAEREASRHHDEEQHTDSEQVSRRASVTFGAGRDFGCHVPPRANLTLL